MEPSSPTRTCPQCGQPLPPGREACANCGRDEANPFTSPAAPIERPIAAKVDPRFYAVIAAVLAISALSAILFPGFAILFAIVFVPAAVRAVAVLKRQESASSSAVKRVGYSQALLASAGVMFLVWLASAIAFSIICFPLGLISFDIRSGPGIGLVVGLVLGFIVGLAVFVWLTRRFWPRAVTE